MPSVRPQQPGTRERLRSPPSQPAGRLSKQAHLARSRGTESTLRTQGLKYACSTVGPARDFARSSQSAGGTPAGTARASSSPPGPAPQPGAAAPAADQPPKYFSARRRIWAGCTSPDTAIVSCGGRAGDGTARVGVRPKTACGSLSAGLLARASLLSCRAQRSTQAGVPPALSAHRAGPIVLGKEGLHLAPPRRLQIVSKPNHRAPAGGGPVARTHQNSLQSLLVGARRGAIPTPTSH